ncbi:MAG TPA: peptidoglycan bridge formation glycyltransferase FemA/FemB family protein [Candidatus Saccharibacteria bacterium]|jgi:lipid II:glycine glycyltransferase (peptidoglycan interpeptide bridge formation enzyme)|nr:peptidoglycan bridge formation glycyltransferase FemA/FemB family protein [Candidatus Saccharibacteria bacterium]
MKKHFLQSSAWINFQKSLGKKTITVKNFDATGFIEGQKPFQRVFFPYGPPLSRQDDLKIFLSLVKNDCRTKGLTYLRIEPVLTNQITIEGNYLKKLGLIKVKDVQPQFTMIVDLRPDAEQIIANMSQSSRNLHRNIYKKGVKFSESNNPEDMLKLIAMLKLVAKRTGMRPHSDNYLQSQAAELMGASKAKLFFAYDKHDNVLAATLIFTDEKIWYYSHSAGNEDARKLQVMAPLLSFIMLEAKKAGANYFDLYGVGDPEDPKHPLTNISKFKQSFGGKVLARSGTWDLPLNKFKYLLYKLALKLRH